MELFCYILLLTFLSNSNSYIYKVNTLSSLAKSLRGLSQDTSFLHFIYGDSHYLNYYYTSLYLGQNKSRQVYILDTGSSITTSPCDQCKSCGEHLNPKYHLENSSKILSCNDNKCKLASNSRCSNNQCSFHISYAEGSRLSGIYVDQEVYFENINMEENITNNSFTIPIGCTTTETHLFKTQLADGIMGLNNNDNSFVGLMYKLGIIQKNIFSLCFEHDGGYFSIGKIYDEFHYTKEIQYVNLVNKNFGNYIINFQYLKIGDSEVKFNGKAVIDSGTTISYFPKLKFKEIMKIILDKCEVSKKCGKLEKTQNYGYCAAIKNDNEFNTIINEGWGNITFKFDDYEYILEPINYYYIYRKSEKETKVCLGFDEDERGNTLLGTTFLHGYDVIFDKEKHRIGFVKADCNMENNKNFSLNNNIENNTDTFTDINQGIEIDMVNINISDNKKDIINETTYIEVIYKDKNDNIKITYDMNNSHIINIIDNVNNTNIKENKTFNSMDISNNYDGIIVKMCYGILCIIFLIFIGFNIILCRDNYSVIQERKDDEEIDKFVIDNFRYDTSNGPISLFNDSI